MKLKKKYIFILILAFVLIGLTTYKAQAAPQDTPVPNVNITVGNTTNPKDYVSNIKLLVMLTLISVLPSFLIMMTSFTRIVVVFSFLKNAIGAQQSIPNQVLIGLALFLTIFIMQPVYNDINANALQPYMDNKITQQQAIDVGSKPLRQFMLKQTRQKDLKLFIEAAKLDATKIDQNTVPLYVVIPAFAISELKTAFQIGFLIFLPFLIIDMVVSSVLMSMGMFMLPPAMISLPFKLLLFVLVDGWYLLVKSLIMSFS
ncbi:flagellar type III secretion system pore protein FliP [Clostridium folliculivorans]|uniref:Flagellar biosynthetic protein FliP n=1 Tax=Clostridium folliculivorans TaxID=2886038 RepID=A0A9W5XZ67_9CLOT|nr:flagellar type III secretion system pore protein FliP [Clostridium folliculivorans]GKU23584.1 flagellar biosynthetic protein FliP [Clostridium folliculivorans]GKU29700.1 flagellar biosynthetic protein FliP [Clostridium folliculivorans]